MRGGGVELDGLAPPVPDFCLTCEASVACAVWLDDPGLWVGPAGEDEVLGDAEEFDGDGDGDGLGEVLGDVEVAVGDGLVLGEPDGLPDADVLGSGDRDAQPGDDVPDVPGLVAPGLLLYPVVPPLAGPEVD